MSSVTRRLRRPALLHGGALILLATALQILPACSDGSSSLTGTFDTLPHPGGGIDTLHAWDAYHTVAADTTADPLSGEGRIP